MRIIAGKHRSRRLLGPVDAATTRPITDRVKTALFDRLNAAGRLEGAVVLDVFSGTGSMGLEALSRGAGWVTFVDRDRVARERLMRNLEALRETEGAEVISGDALSSSLVARVAGRRYGLIFFDPPYRMVEQERTARKVFGQIGRLAEVAEAGAWLVLRTSEHAEVGAVEGWEGPEAHRYGSMVLHFYRKGEGGEETGRGYESEPAGA